MQNKHLLLKIVTIAFFISAANLLITAQDYKVGDKSDGSRMKPVHLLKLYDASGNTIIPNDQIGIPFSTKQTCAAECHSYEKISHGFHFNYNDSNLVNSTPSEPWIYTDPTTLSMIPLSYRKNKGTFTPDEINMTPMEFLFRFGPYYPGGDISETDSLQHPDNYFRWDVSGKLEVNCLMCHDNDPHYDRAEYAGNIRKQNFKWAATASSSLVEFQGNASRMPDNYDIYNPTTIQSIDQRSPIVPKLSYDKTRFNLANKVYFDITKNVSNDNCYFCHSTIVTDENFDEHWKSEEDVHIKAGINCVDCHRNGIDHNMVKGVESTSLSCEGCHINNSDNINPTSGSLGAPIAGHDGIPPIHFEKLTCTTCHTGNWPSDKAIFVKTSRNHFLGMHGTNKAPDVFPHIATNIFTESNSDKLEPRNVVWPSYWGDKNGNEIKPLPINFVEEKIRPMLSLDSLVNFGSWPAVSDSLVIAILDSLKSMEVTKGIPVFVTGGKVFELNVNGIDLTSYADASALGYSWKRAHVVRPASQALGVNGCQDCHSIGSPFFTSEVNVESSLISQSNKTISTSEFQNNSKLYQTFFASTFFFRPWLKGIIILSSLLILIVLAGYIFHGVKSISSLVADDKTKGKE